MFDEDLDAFVDPQHFGVPVTFDGAPADLHGIESFRDAAELTNDGRGEVIGRVRTLLLRTDAAALLAIGSPLTVNSAARRVQDPKARLDGAFTLLVIA